MSCRLPSVYRNCFFTGSLTQPLVPIRYGKQKIPHNVWDFLFGLPDRIRTCGLQSRSLTRYPAVPRVDFSFGLLCSISHFSRFGNGFFEISHTLPGIFSRPFSPRLILGIKIPLEVLNRKAGYQGLDVIKFKAAGTLFPRLFPLLRLYFTTKNTVCQYF